MKKKKIKLIKKERGKKLMYFCPWCGCELIEKEDYFYCESCDQNFDKEVLEEEEEED